jgi:hypothetical protein
MGVTIHYQGYLRSPELLSELAARVQVIADRHDWVVKTIDKDEVELIRVINEEIVEYTSPLKGLVILAHERCEPIRFVFDRDWFTQEGTKTQFCPTAIHVQIVELLRAVEDLFDDFKVLDEGECWETGTTEILNQKKRFLNTMIDHLKSVLPDAAGPVDIPDPRFEDPPYNDPHASQ